MYAFVCSLNDVDEGLEFLSNNTDFIQLGTWNYKKNFSTALMIDQRVSEGIESIFFNKKALTTTIPAQLVKKFNVPIVPIFIERVDEIKFKIIVNKPLKFSNNSSVQKITDELNKVLEKMILRKPDQWIWSHNRWK